MEEDGNYLTIIYDLHKGHSSTQKNERHNRLQAEDLQWEHQQYDKKTSRT